jgi:hypothetical protein
MLRFVIRFLGLLIFAASFVALIADGIRSLAAGRIVLTPLGQSWFAINPDSMNAVEWMVERYLHPYVWNPLIQTVLSWPTFAVGSMVGILLMLAGSGRRDRVLAA